MNANVPGPSESHAAPGYIVLAAYRPDPTLFERQVRSIQSQTVDNFRCIVTADGEPDAVRELLTTITDSDPRFSVLGYENRLGFYENFERGLAAVPSDAAWVALADQDDRWDENKLELLLPYLDEFAVVSGQARVTRFPGDTVISETTGRKNTPVAAFTLDNQYTGSFMVFRTEVLGAALPLPRPFTPSHVHDHWIAVVGAFLGGSVVLEIVAQDYVQHGANVIGEARARSSPLQSLRNARALALKHEGSSSLRAIAHVTYRFGVEWRAIMMSTLCARLDGADIDSLVAVYGPQRRFFRTMKAVWTSAWRGDVTKAMAMVYTAGWGASSIFRFRRDERRFATQPEAHLK